MKIISAVILLSLCFTFAVAETPDPIVGIWYMDLESTPDMPSIPEFEGVKRALIVTGFEEGGDISLFEIDYEDATFNVSEPTNIGKWQNAGVVYVLKIVGTGTTQAYIRNGDLHAQIYTPDAYYIFHRIQPADWYSDIHR